MKLLFARYLAQSVENLSLGSSPVHRVHPTAKLVVTLLYLFAVVSLQNIGVLLPFFIYPAVLMNLSGSPYRLLFSRVLIALPFPLFGGIFNLFIMKEPVYIGAFAVTTGLISFISIMIKTILSVTAVLILIATTSFVDIMYSLRKFPNVICIVFMLTYRYLWILLDETAQMYTAYMLRSPEKSIKFGDIGSFLGQLILRSFAHASRIYAAMKCRGFNGAYTALCRKKFGAYDFLYVIIWAFLIVFLREARFA
ncbi:hypothetical protein AGMMS49975_17660 [Clostridia bacterium]|nr:hypothetical protein AGMMS49975_17660 [Clostridia bacterium]